MSEMKDYFDDIHWRFRERITEMFSRLRPESTAALPPRAALKEINLFRREHANELLAADTSFSTARHQKIEPSKYPDSETARAAIRSAEMRQDQARLRAVDALEAWANELRAMEPTLSKESSETTVS